jgi:hypothetical protein
MKEISNYSIRGKLTMIVMVSTFASLLLALLTMGLIDTLSFSTQMRQDAISATAVLGSTHSSCDDHKPPRRPS